MNYSLLFDQAMHGVVGLPFAVYIFYKSRSLRQSLIVLFVVIFIDVDHLVDYWKYYGLKLNIYEFLRLEYYAVMGSALIPFHGWEWSILLFYIAKLKKNPWASIYMALSIGIFAHLTWDIHNFWSVEFYSIIWRALNGFKFV